MGASIGTWAARLWKGEVGALFLPSGNDTPWDSTPVYGISRKLGYEFLRHGDAGWTSYDPPLPATVSKREYDSVVGPPGLIDAARRTEACPGFIALRFRRLSRPAISSLTTASRRRGGAYDCRHDMSPSMIRLAIRIGISDAS
jgi:hypothetical protein